MTFETKVSLGSWVVGIGDDSAYKIVACETCQNTGKVTIGAEQFVCPKCNGKASHPLYVGRKWFISTTGQVGKIQIEAIDRELHQYLSPDEPAVKVTYMLTSTGVGSGRIWDEDLLFHSREAAQSECDKRNGLLDMTGQVEPKEALI